MATLTLFKLGAWLAALTTGGVGVGVLWRARALGGRVTQPRSIGLLQLTSAALTTFACFVLASIAFAAAGVNAFGLIRLAYLCLAVVPASLGLTLLVLAWWRNPVRVPPYMRVVGLLLLLPAPLCAYASFIEPYRLQIERAEIPVGGLPPDAEPIRVVVLADLQTDHVSAYERHVVDGALAEQPDLILLPGDFFQGSRARFQAELPRFRGLLARLNAPGGVFACRGNIDPPAYLQALFEDTSVRLLDDEVAVTEVGGLRVAVGGVDWHYRTDEARRVPRQLAEAETDIRILIAHTPDAVAIVEPSHEIDLVVAGHTHGGQVVVPGFGPLFTASWLPRRVAGGGLHRAAGQMLYVSRGVGFERGAAPPVRFGCPPELSVLTLRADR